MTTTKNKASAKTTQLQLTAKEFIEQLKSLRVKSIDNARFFRDDDKTNKILGVRMSNIFSLAKKFTGLPLKILRNYWIANIMKYGWAL